MNLLKQLRPAHWAFIHFKLVVGILWPCILLPARPLGLSRTLGAEFIGLAALLTIMGAAISIVGVVMTAQRESVVRTIGLSVELFGICLFAMLPLAYCIAEVVLFLTGDEFGLSRLAVGVLAWGVIAAIIARAATLYPAWRAEATDKHKAR